jgi:uncharacterized membrane protein YfcA
MREVILASMNDTAPLLVIATLAACFVSGIFGMAGGLALMGLFAAVLPVPEAMVLHGLAMGVANGSRAWFLRDRVRKDLVVRYLRGALLAALLAAALLAFGFVPPRPMLLFGLGAVPLLLLLLPQRWFPGMADRGGAETCGALVTATQAVVGASGPLLDAFYLRNPLDRHAVVGTKAVTQTLGHALKVIAFAIAGGAGPGSIAASPAILAVAVAAVAGTAIGRTLLDRMEDGAFRRWSRALVLVLCSILIVQAVFASTAG